MPLFNSGYHADARAVAARTVKLFADAGHVVVPSGSCAWMVKAEYPGLLADDPALHAEARALAARTYELSQFLVEVLKVSGVGSTFSGTLTYHDSCHLLRGLGESRAPRTLLRGVKGCEIVELPGSDECCGFGGALSGGGAAGGTPIPRQKPAHPGRTRPALPPASRPGGPV